VKLGLGCVAHLMVLAAVAVFVDQLTSARLPPELRLYVVVPTGLLLTAGLSNLWTLARGYGQGDRSRAAMLERARTGEPPPQDGPIAATGVVRAEGGALRAPISGLECVAYQYRLYTSQWLADSDHREVPIYWGYASQPFRIDSPRHAFRVIAAPQLGDKATRHDSRESRARAKAYVAATRYEPKRALVGIASAAAAMLSERVREPEGDVRRDWQAADVDIDIDALLMEEIVVPVGATVSVSGRWSAERRAILPGEIGEGQLGVTLVTGTAENLGRGGSSELPWSVLSVAVTAGGLLLVGAAVVWLSVTGQVAEWWRALQ
jgi:hypothetical protein